MDCGGDSANEGPPSSADRDAGEDGGELDPPLVPATKVDILFVVDSSLDKILRPLVASSGRPHAPINDIHLGVISTSLGAMGGDICPSEGRLNDRAYLQKWGANGGSILPDDSPGVLEFRGDDFAGFVTKAQELILGVGETGCGLEAQLESMYRFLVQPDPWTQVVLDSNNQANLAAKLPAFGEDFCDLPDSGRSRRLVHFVVIGGVPHQLVRHPMSAENWVPVLGRDWASYDATGTDPHMVQSPLPRSGLEPPSDVRGDNGTDPIHGREWTTNGDDLQYACTFDLPEPRTCTASEIGCYCAFTERNPPVCASTLGVMLKAKAQPTPRPLRVAQALGEQAIVRSICPVQLSDPTRDDYAYALPELHERLASVLAPK